MSSWTRWRLAFPLIGLSSLFLFAATLGAVAWWSDSSPVERLLSVVNCGLLAGAVAASVLVGVRRGHDDDLPWARIGLAVLAMLLSCAVTLLRRTLA